MQRISVFFPNVHYKRDYRLKITNKDSLINRLEHLVTKKFIEDLNTCCSEKNCPDSINGYWIILKVNDEEYSQCIDKVFISRELCGNETLDEVLDIFDKLSSE